MGLTVALDFLVQGGNQACPDARVYGTDLPFVHSEMG